MDASLCTHINYVVLAIAKKSIATFYNTATRSFYYYPTIVTNFED